jgi:hypothetical protein
MSTEEEEDMEIYLDPGGDSKKRKLVPPKKKSRVTEITDEDYKIFTKPGYKRTYPDNSSTGEFPVYVEGVEYQDKIGNRNPLQLSKLFKAVKGIWERRRINANKIMLVFKQASAANDFLNDSCLQDNNMRAYIPASSVETVGVIRYIPKETSNFELFKKLTSDCEIIRVRRFTKKIEGEMVPLTTISVTFAGTILPQYIYLDNWRYKVDKFIPPLMQCFKCMKFNHSAYHCRNEQVCSKCSGNHSYKECENDEIKCSNCQGAHLAISKLCPIKSDRLVKHQNIHKGQTYAAVTNYNVSNNFPPLSQTRKNILGHNTKISTSISNDNVNQNKIDINMLINNSKIIDSFVKTLVTLGNSNKIKTIAHIKEILIKNLNS